MTKVAVVEFMRITILVALLILAGCASRPTIEELETEALVTGDWSAVEERERAKRKRLEATAPGCSLGAKKVCVETGITADVDCRCFLPAGKR